MKQVQFLRHLNQLKFSGQLMRTHSAGQRWNFYFSQGTIVYATGGIHPIRRWVRHLQTYCPTKASRKIWHADLEEVATSQCPFGWEYTLLSQWISRQEITIEQAINVIHSILVEILFDIIQAGEITDQIKPDPSLNSPIQGVKLERITANAQMRWQAWQEAKLVTYSPHRTPIIRQADLLQEHSSKEFYQTLNSLLNGQHTLLDLASKMRRGVAEIAASLLPFIQRGWIELIEVEDFVSPVQHHTAQPTIASPANKLIACIDDSFLVRHLMEKLITSAGYQYLGVEDAMRSIGILLARKPDLIFLDLIMPNTNGHEVCSQLRKLSCFRETPIIILTGSDGFANRLKSNFVGASDFLAKPLNAETVLAVIQKYLEQPTVEQPQPEQPPSTPFSAVLDHSINTLA